MNIETEKVEKKDKEDNEEVLSKKYKKISIYDEIKNYISLISEHIINNNWENAINDIKKFQSIVISMFINRGIDVTKLNEMFDELINTIKSNYDYVGNNLIKRDDCFEQLNDIINYIGNCGVYIGQQKIFVTNYIDVLNEKIKELTKIAGNIILNPSDRDTFIMICEFIRDNIIPYIEVPSETIRYRIMEEINSILSIVPVYTSRPTATFFIEFGKSFSNLRTYADILILSNRSKGFREFFKEHEKDFEIFGEKQIENIVRKIVMREIKGVVEEQE